MEPEMTETGTIPDVSGLGARDAIRLLESMGLNVRLHGQGRVLKQNIPAGSKPVRGQTITLELGMKKK